MRSYAYEINIYYLIQTVPKSYLQLKSILFPFYFVLFYSYLLPLSIIWVFVGFGRCLVYKKQTCAVKRYANQTFDRIMGPKVDRDTYKPIWKHQALDMDGIAAAGTTIWDSESMIVNFVKFS